MNAYDTITQHIIVQLGDFLKRVSQAQKTQIPNIGPIWAVWECSGRIACRYNLSRKSPKSLLVSVRLHSERTSPLAMSQRPEHGTSDNGARS